jgi:hypothetical protein
MLLDHDPHTSALKALIEEAEAAAASCRTRYDLHKAEATRLKAKGLAFKEKAAALRKAMEGINVPVANQ